MLILRGCWPTKPTKLLNRPLNIQSEGKRGPVFKAMWDEPSVPHACLFQSSLLLYFPTQRICMKAPQTPGLERGYVSQHIRLGARGRIIYEINTPKWWNHKRDWAFSAGSRQSKQRNASAGLLWFSRPDESGFLRSRAHCWLGLQRQSHNSIKYTSWRAIELISVVAMFRFLIYMFVYVYLFCSPLKVMKTGASV